MQTIERGEFGAVRAFAFVAVALLGLALAFTPWVERIDNAVLDAQWSVLRKFAPRAAPPDIVIVGIDERTAKSIAAPPGMWHESLGLALARIASARPRAIGLDLALPERSFEDVRPGLDRALLVGLAAARQNGPLVASLSIDARTRTARPVHPPFLALLGEERLGLDLLARDLDGVTRRFALAVPTEDGSFPTFAGRLCRALSQQCVDGLLHFALGEPFGYIPLQRLLETQEVGVLEKMFGGRVVLLGEIPRFGSRIAVPVNLARWEEAARDTPSVLVHAQSLRTALQRVAPREATRPPVVLLVSIAAALVLIRNWRHALVLGILAIGGILVLGTLALNAGVYIPVAGAILTVLLAVLARVGQRFASAFELRRRT